MRFVEDPLIEWESADGKRRPFARGMMARALGVYRDDQPSDVTPSYTYERMLPTVRVRKWIASIVAAEGRGGIWISPGYHELRPLQWLRLYVKAMFRERIPTARTVKR